MRLMTFMDSYPSIPGPLQPSGPIFSQLKTLKVMDIYHLQVAKFVFKSMNLITWLRCLIFTAAIGVRIPVMAVIFHNVNDYTIVWHPWQVFENHKPRVHPSH